MTLQENWPEMYWNALADLDKGKAVPVPSPHPKFSVQVRSSSSSSSNGSSRCCGHPQLHWS
jgi:hypothetical protein